MNIYKIGLVCILIYVLTAGLLFAAAIQMEGSERVMEVRGPGEDTLLGRPLLCADLNGDGFDELILGTNMFDYTGTEIHRVYIFRGRGSYSGVDLVDLSSESADVVIQGETGSMDFPTALASGDVNNDGIADLLLADSTLTANGRTGAGVVYVLFGRSDFLTKSLYSFQTGDWDVKIHGAQAGGDLGGAGMAPFGGSASHAVATGDVNNDGIDDIIAGAHFTQVGSNSLAGSVYIVFGKTSFSHGQTIDLLSQADGVIQGNEKDGEMGTDISIGDVSGDGIADIVIGEELSSEGLWTYEGKVFVVYGRIGFPSTMSISSANLTIRGAYAGDQLGDAVALSDVNGDGIDDIIALAYGWDHAHNSSTSEGGVYGFFGRSNFPSSIDLASQSPDFFVEGYNTTNSLYWPLCAGDYNGDGIGDFMCTSRDGERPGFSSEGRTYLFFGKTTFSSAISVENEDFDYIINGGTDNLQLCDTFASGDIDKDGADEILLGAPFVDSWTGRVLVFDLNPRTPAKTPWECYE